MSLSDIKKMYDITQDFKWSVHCADDKDWEEITSWYRERKLEPRVQRLWVGFWIMFVGLNLFWVWNEDKNRFYLKGLSIFYDDGWYDRYWYPGQIMYYVEGAVELISKAGINNAGKVV